MGYERWKRREEKRKRRKKIKYKKKESRERKRTNESGAVGGRTEFMQKMCFKKCA